MIYPQISQIFADWEVRSGLRICVHLRNLRMGGPQ